MIFLYECSYCINYYLEALVPILFLSYSILHISIYVICILINFQIFVTASKYNFKIHIEKGKIYHLFYSRFNFFLFYLYLQVRYTRFIKFSMAFSSYCGACFFRLVILYESLIKIEAIQKL